MSLIQDFINCFDELGVDKSYLPCYEYPNCTVMQVRDEVDAEFATFIAFYNDGGAEVFLVRDIVYDDRLDVLEKINSLNDKYHGVCFVLRGNQLIAKSFCKPQENVYSLIMDLTSSAFAANGEFYMFKPSKQQAERMRGDFYNV